MKTFLIKRNLSGAGLLTPSEKKTIARRSCTVIEELGTDKLQWMHSYITADHLWCIYKATDESILKRHAEKGPFPLEEIREIFGLISPETAEIETIPRTKLNKVFQNVKAVFVSLILLVLTSLNTYAQKDNLHHSKDSAQFFIDVHKLEPGKVKFEDVAAAHAKDLATQSKYDVQFIKYWVDEKNGLVYCLSSAHDTASIRNAHAEAHGLIPQKVYAVIPGTETRGISPENLFLDIHYLEPGKVTAADVEAAHQKDLAAEGRHGVRFINYWVDEKAGVVMCLSQAPDAAAVAGTHSEAHGLIPASVASVKEGK
jgi:hypothetical protein